MLICDSWVTSAISFLSFFQFENWRNIFQKVYANLMQVTFRFISFIRAHSLALTALLKRASPRSQQDTTSQASGKSQLSQKRSSTAQTILPDRKSERIQPQSDRQRVLKASPEISNQWPQVFHSVPWAAGLQPSNSHIDRFSSCELKGLSERKLRASRSGVLLKLH